MPIKKPKRRPSRFADPPLAWGHINDGHEPGRRFLSDKLDHVGDKPNGQSDVGNLPQLRDRDFELKLPLRIRIVYTTNQDRFSDDQQSIA